MLALLSLDEMFIAGIVEKHEQFAGVVQWLESQSSKLAIRVRFSPPAPGDLPKWQRGLFAKQLGRGNLAHWFDPNSLRQSEMWE